MTSLTPTSPTPAEKLYALLPAIHRIRDAAEGEPLRALLAILEQEFDTLEQDIEGLYDNWFIETCDEWVVPYIGDLLDVRELYAKAGRGRPDENNYGQQYGQQERRAYVANTLAYRRRKGTVPILEQLVQDITGWRSRAVEFFQLLATTQNINHERPSNTTVDLRSGRQPDRIGTAFERQASYSLEVRNTNQGRYNLPTIGLFIWRLRSYATPVCSARLVEGDRGYTFDPIGSSQPLFNRPQTATDTARLTREINVPAPLRRTALKQEIENLQQRLALGQKIEDLSDQFDLSSQQMVVRLKREQQALAAAIPRSDRYLDNSQPVFSIYFDGEQVPAEEISIQTLAEENNRWKPPQAESGSRIKAKVVVDPESGRLWCLSLPPQSVQVSYSYGFSGDVGSGVYDRRAAIAQTMLGSHKIWRVDSAQALTDATLQWNEITQLWLMQQQQQSIVLGRIALDGEGKVQEWQHNQLVISPPIVVSPGSRELLISSGTIKNGRGATLMIKAAQQVGFSADDAYLTITIFATAADSGNDALIAAAPEIDRGVILLTNSLSYPDAIAVNVSANKQLSIVAANGQRPHLCGNIYARGVATNRENPGAIALEGLLLEGRLILLAGHLKHLQISHCTLVPSERALSGMRVDALLSPLDREEDLAQSGIDSVMLMALWLYLFTLIQQIIKIGFDSQRSTPQKNLHKLWWIAQSQLSLLIASLKEIFQTCAAEGETDLLDLPGYKTFQSVTYLPDLACDNAALTVTVERSITGPLALAETIPTLVCTDSLIHQGWTSETPIAAQGQRAIAASGANATINTTTVFGATKVREITANNSLFTDTLQAQLQQSGCVRFSSLPPTSKTPRRERTQPDLSTQKLDQIPPAINAIVQQPNSQIMWAATAGQGFYVRDFADETAEWTAHLPLDLRKVNITALTISQQQERTVFLVGTDSGKLLYAMDLSSDNLGEGWQSMSLIASGQDQIGEIVSRGRLVTGTDTVFQSGGRVQVGDRITAANQTRVIQQVLSNTELLINAPFQPAISQPTSFRTNLGQTDAAITALLIKDEFWFVGTAGGGLFRSANEGVTWDWLNIPKRKITCLMATENRNLLAGTSGGLFLSEDNGQQWQVLERGLPTLPVTCLTSDRAGQIFAGTESQGVFRSTDGGFFWQSIGLAQWPVTGLIAKHRQTSGTISSKGDIVTGVGTEFRSQLKVGDAITVQNQTRTIQSIDSNTQLTLTLAFYPAIPEETAFESSLLIAGTQGGGTFRVQGSSTTEGNTWERVNTSTTTSWVSTLTWIEPTDEATDEAAPPVEAALLGTTLGNFLTTPDRGSPSDWVSADQGLTAVDSFLQEVIRLQPSFTANQHGPPGFGQLALSCPTEILTGAEDGSEMGAFSYLKQPQRQANLSTSLDEYLRFGLSANLFYLT